MFWYKRHKKRKGESDGQVEAETEVHQIEHERYKGAELPSP